MNRQVLKVLGVTALAVALTAAGGYKFYQSAHAQTTPALGAHMELADAQAGAWLGIMIANLDQQLATKLGINLSPGVVILRVMPKSPADTAGLKPKDVITQINGNAVSSVNDFKSQLAGLSPGNSVTLGIAGKQDVTVTAGTQPAPPAKPDRPHRAGPDGPGGLPIPPGLGGTNFDDRYGGQFKSKDGTVDMLFGTVFSITGNQVAIKPNDPAAPVTPVNLTVGPDTKLRGSINDLHTGDKVVAVTKNGTVIVLMKAGPMPIPPHPGARPKPAQQGSGAQGSGQWDQPKRAVAAADASLLN